MASVVVVAQGQDDYDDSEEPEDEEAGYGHMLYQPSAQEDSLEFGGDDQRPQPCPVSFIVWAVPCSYSTAVAGFRRIHTSPLKATS
ncbi:hypothetical protein [Mycobacterium leprae]|uniref:hypothetical protein n=1 Tax=Mycobacterium leprae TaxID=1769 RepID=UPI0019550607|nr:hypothetical protein [Mycobacterium leprae]